MGSLELSRDEMEAMSRQSPVDLVLYDEGDGRLRINFSDHDHRCPMLLASGHCRIYEDRPQACRRYPSQPDPRCAVWPAFTENE